LNRWDVMPDPIRHPAQCRFSAFAGTAPGFRLVPE
jgi:hypothetical protein